MEFHRLRPAWPWWAFAGVLAFAWIAYLPGLAGGFLFDDFVNLPAIGGFGAIDNAPAFWRYITSGTADPTGRPLSLLSFLIDARNWPADPEPFLRTNVLLHLANGCLLYLLLRVIGRPLGDKDAPSSASAVVGAGLWLLHPLFVSTTLYIVQREAMLATTFVLLGLMAYAHGRERYLRHATVAGAAWMLAGIGGGTALAMACKANGALLPVLAWVLEATVLRRSGNTEPSFRWWRRCLVVFPSLLLFAWLASQLRDIGVQPEIRAWTIGERLLTQPRALMDYLYLLLVPRALSTGLFNDAYPVSENLFQPATTGVAIITIVLLVAVGFALRRRAPTWSAALLFFFAGHLLESTTIPLELYYEHRNYLPAVLLFWAPARALCQWRVSPQLRVVAATTLLALFAGITYQRTLLWGHPADMARLWAHRNPTSPRAQAAAAMADLQQRRPHAALRRLTPLTHRRPHDLQLVLNYVDAACAARGLTAVDIALGADTLRNAREGQQLASYWLGKALDTAAEKRCKGLDISTLERWLDAARHNPIMHRPGARQDLAALSGRIALVRRDPATALAQFNHALAYYPTPGAAGQQAALLGSRGYVRQALAHLDYYDRIEHRRMRASGWNMSHMHEWILDKQGYWPRELSILRATLQADLNSDAAWRAPGAVRKNRKPLE